MQFQDATLDVQAGLGGLHSVTLTCRNFTRTYTPDQVKAGALLKDLYSSGIDALARPLDAPIGKPTGPVA